MGFFERKPRDRGSDSAGSGRLEAIDQPFTRARSSDRRGGVPPRAQRIMRVRANTRRVVTLLVVSLLVCSLLAPIAAASTASASTAPSGMVGVPDANLGPTADEWNVMADRHADSLELEIAESADGEPTLIATDDEHSEGRTIAVDRATLAEAVGHEPRRIHGENDESEDWSAEVRYSDEYALLDIPHFSTNEITFDGTVQIDGTGITDQTSFDYTIDDSGGIDSVSAELTGERTEHDVSTSGVDSGSIDVDGDQAPTDSQFSGTVQNQGLHYHDGDYITDKRKSDVVSSELSGNVDLDQIKTVSVTAEVYDSNSGGDSADYYSSDVPLKLYVEGESWGSITTSNYPDEKTWSGNYDVPSDGSVAMEFVWAEGSYYDGSHDYEISDVRVSGDENANFDVSVNGGSKTVTSGESTSIDLQRGTNDIETSSTRPVEWDADWTEYHDTQNPSISVNGETASYDGTITEGETQNLEIDPAWIKDGQNEVVVATDNSNGHTTTTGLSFSHAAGVDQSVSYDAETWSERYNVSRTWDDATGDASVTIPFSSNRVVSIRDVQMRPEGGTWSDLAGDDYTLDGTTLTAQLGNVDANEQIDVRATGSKVGVENGAINVLEPTVEGNTVDTAVEIADYSDSFGIDIGNTSEANWIHKTANESWTAPETFVSVDADGGQTIRAPGASAGSTMHVRTVPLEVNPNAGSVDLQLLESDREAKFDVDPSSSASEVEYRWHDTVSGDDYVLYSETHGIARDSATASSPVTLVTKSFDETLSIIHDVESTNGSSPAGGGGGGFGGAVASTAGGVSPILVLGLGVVGLAGTALVAQRMELPMTVVAGVGLLVGILGLETISPGTITDGVRSALVLLSSDISPIMPLVILIVVGAGAYGFVRWLQARAGPDTAVTLDLGSRKK